MADSERVTVGAIRDYFKYKKDGASTLSETFAVYRDLRKAKSDIHKGAPEGDGHPVLVIPAFTANDILTHPLRNIIRKKGYKTYGWKGKFNLGMTEKKAEHIRERLKEVYQKNDGKKVTLIGHSLGGFYARELAREYPEMVRAAITINTPFGIGVFKDATPPLVLAMIGALSHDRYSLNGKGVAERMLTPPPVPTTSIFSKIDVVAGAKACLNPKTPLSENIEVETSHIASVWHPETLKIILDRLAQPEGQWKPYKDPSAEPRPANPNWKPGKNKDWRFF